MKVNRPPDDLLKRLLVDEKQLRRAIEESYRRASQPQYTLRLALVSAFLWVLSTIIIAGAVGFLVNIQQWWGLATLALLSLVGVTYYRLRRFQVGALTWAGVAYLAELYLSDTKGAVERARQAERKVRESERGAQRMHVALEHVNEAVKWFGRALDAQDSHVLAASVRRSLLSTLKFFSTLAHKEGMPQPRCGLLVRDQEKPDEVIPLLVYSPRRDEYVSRSRFSMKEDFTGILLSEFDAHRDAPDAHRFLFDYIPDTAEHLRKERRPRFRHREEHHPREVISILGHVVYLRRDGEYVTQGALNIDSPEVDGIDFKAYRSMEAQQRPMFQIINAVLGLAARNRQVFKEIHEPVQRGSEGQSDGEHSEVAD